MKRLNKFIFLCLMAMLCQMGNAQLTPQVAVKQMMRGYNLGNSFDGPNEGAWSPMNKERFFKDLKAAGFTAIRMPISWGDHIGKASPYKINTAFFTRIDTVITWALRNKLIIVINAHHEDWLHKNVTALTPANMERFDSLWSQIATRFKNKSDSLLFEILNEPVNLPAKDVDTINARILKTIRKSNPTRIVVFSGNKWANSGELVNAKVPNPADKYLMGYYHSYDPYPFGLDGPGTYGSAKDIANTKAKFDEVTAWSVKNNIPVMLGEYGYVDKCEYNSRMCAYATVMDQAFAHNVATFVWDNNGNFQVYNRSTYEFNDIKDVLVHTYKESPIGMRIGNYKPDTLVQLKWTNRTSLNDSIIVERKLNMNDKFVFFKKISPTASSFVDSTTQKSKTYYYRLRANLNDSIEIQSYPIMIKNLSDVSVPYSGTPALIPGTIEAENFDIGLKGISYFNPNDTCTGGNYRPGVGIGIYQLGARESYYVSNVQNEEWMNYSIKVSKTGYFKISAYISALELGGQFTLSFKNGNLTFSTTATGGLASFKAVSQYIFLDSGTQVMQLKIVSIPNFSIDRLLFATSSSVEAQNKPKEFSIYSSLVTNEITIDGVEGKAVVEIYSLTGSLIKKQAVNGNHIKIAVNELPNGLYILKYHNAAQSYSQKFIK